jgi:aminopeptidase N
MNNIKYRKDYKPSDYLIDSIHLHIELDEEVTSVKATSKVKRNSNVANPSKDLCLDGREQELKSVCLNGVELSVEKYQLTKETLTILDVPENFTLEIISHIKPQENTSLMGLYKSRGIFCTQCESDGFPKITYYLDRPDVMADFVTTIVADKKKYPVLLANGNLAEESDVDLPNGRHMAKWHDPFKKPCYLFAMVAGNLSHIEDTFTTMSGRKVILRIFSEPKNVEKCHFSMSALKKSMRWDEINYGREYDLDIFMIVAVDDFNFGAMENKGLNIFNTQYILANPKTATDKDYADIDTVVSHEYFHNWTGDRVTVRDWFQLTLKEGLTVLRDHEFSQDEGLAEVVRIEQVKRLRNIQFPEDAGPLAHPIRPDSYIEMGNFYTATVYEKGAEVIRMQKIFLGKEGYRKGTDLYFARHDGQAVTCEDFIKAMEDANQVDFTQLRKWYEQAGTPELSVTSQYDEKNSQLQLKVIQTCPATPGQTTKQPFQIPLKMGLLDSKGNDMPLKLLSHSHELKESVLNITQQEETFVFCDIKEKPIPSFLRGFSAPIKIQYNYSETDLSFLIEHDHDAFSAWEAGQNYAILELKKIITAIQKNQSLKHSDLFVTAMNTVLNNSALNKAFIATMLILPTEVYISELVDTVDVTAIYQARKYLMQVLAQSMEKDFINHYQQNVSKKTYQYNPSDAAQRHLKNTCLSYLCLLEENKYDLLALEQYNSTDNMTDQLSALTVLSRRENAHRESVLKDFYMQWKSEPLVLDKWFFVQAMADIPDALLQVKALMQHPDFDIKNPNKVRSLIGGFTSNLVHFHDLSGEGYAFLADQAIILDKINPMVTARLLAPLTRWHRYDEKRQGLMKAQLQRILAIPDLSKNVYEIVGKSLG